MTDHEETSPTRGDTFQTLGKLERDLDLPGRPEVHFTHHADRENYLSGRKFNPDPVRKVEQPEHKH